MRFADAAALEAWLEAHHGDTDELWIEFAKKGSGEPSVTRPETLDLMLCFGWIDGLVRSIDERFYRQRYTPRRARSKWSKINCAKAEELIAAGRMLPAGLAEVERAKADGRWDAAYDPPSKIAVPDDLRAALDANAAAAREFSELNSINRYAVLYRIADAKRPETRARRIETFVAMLARGERPVP